MSVLGGRWLVVARREFVERVRNKWFLIVTVLGPLLMVGILVAPVLIATHSAEKGVHIDVVDRSGRGLGKSIAARAGLLGPRFNVVPPETTDEALGAKVRDRSIDGFLILPEDTLANPEVPNSCQTCHQHEDEDLADLQRRFDALSARVDATGQVVSKAVDAGAGGGGGDQDSGSSQ